MTHKIFAPESLRGDSFYTNRLDSDSFGTGCANEQEQSTRSVGHCFQSSGRRRKYEIFNIVKMILFDITSRIQK